MLGDTCGHGLLHHLVQLGGVGEQLRVVAVFSRNRAQIGEFLLSRDLRGRDVRHLRLEARLHQRFEALLENEGALEDVRISLARRVVRGLGGGRRACRCQAELLELRREQADETRLLAVLELRES